MYPFIGKSVYIDYDSSKFLLEFISDKFLNIEGTLNDVKIKEVVEYTIIQVDRNVYKISWFERFNKTLVVQVQNTHSLRTYTTIVEMLSGNLYELKGKITPMKSYIDNVNTTEDKNEAKEMLTK